MIVKTKVGRAAFPLALVTSVAVTIALTLPLRVVAQQDQEKAQDQQKQDQAQTDQQKKKGGGGIFGGLKAVTTQSSDQNKATASAGTKGALDGKEIADKTPTSADMQQVTDMENYSVPQGDLKKFQEDGHLQPK
jgi:cytoskeletal protein RodZ